MSEKAGKESQYSLAPPSSAKVGVGSERDRVTTNSRSILKSFIQIICYKSDLELVCDKRKIIYIKCDYDIA